jgi:hypothetical protein
MPGLFATIRFGDRELRNGIVVSQMREVWASVGCA